MATFLERIIDKLDNPGDPTTPTRALDTTFAPSATDYVLCLYTIQMVITTGQTSTVVLNSDSASPPTTPRASATSNVVGTVRQQLVFVCKAGDNIRLVSSGAGAATIADQTEIVIS